MRGVVALLFCALSVAEAQLPSLTPGTRVRVNMRDRSIRVTGAVMSQTSDSLTVGSSGAGWSGLAAGSVTRVRVSQGRSRSAGALRGGKIGGLIGLGLGALLGSMFAGVSLDPYRDLILITAILGSEGAVLGGLIGMAVKAERWRTVYRSSSKVAVGVDAQGRPAIGLNLRF